MRVSSTYCTVSFGRIRIFPRFLVKQVPEMGVQEDTVRIEFRSFHQKLVETTYDSIQYIGENHAHTMVHNISPSAVCLRVVLNS